MDDLELQQRLRGAVHAVAVPPDLKRSVQRRLRRLPAPWASAVAAALVVAMAGGVAYWEGNRRLTPQVNVGMRGALGDHVHCAVFRTYPAQTPTLARLADGLGSFRNIVPALAGREPAGYHMVMAHECGFEGSQFTHIIFKKGARLLSVAISREATAASTEIQEASLDRFQLAETAVGRYRIFVISDLPEPENRATLDRMAPSIRYILNNI